MTNNDLWTDNDSRLEEIVRIIPESAFCGVPVMTVAEFLQLPPVRIKLIFSRFSN